MLQPFQSIYMETIRLSRQFYRGKRYIFFYIPYDENFNRLIRAYPGRRWSTSRRCWYIDDNEESYRKIRDHFRGHFNIDATGLFDNNERESGKADPSGGNRADKQGKEPADQPYGPVSMAVNPVTGRLVIKFEGRFRREWIGELKQYGHASYNPANREWSLAATRAIIDSLTAYFNDEGIKLVLRKGRQPAHITERRELGGTEVRRREISEESAAAIRLLRTYLHEKRYSRHTVDSYLSQLEFFFKYFHERKPSEITNKDISEFMENYVISLGYSVSYQNQLITAIKTYYSLSGDADIQVEDLKRPRKGRPLPQVFSREEVTGILNSTGNLKHRLILWVIYSCGLRRSEVINIRLSDLNRGRGILHIRGGKGLVDRVVPVSEKVWQKVDEYMVAYKPSEYLFEGQGGGRYTAGSVYNVFKQALKSVGIEKEVGVHSLRHSYATHLHESGYDIRYIQELLGHRSSRTTEIYTHVSRRDLANIRSPIDDLDLK